MACLDPTGLSLGFRHHAILKLQSLNSRNNSAKCVTLRNPPSTLDTDQQMPSSNWTQPLSSADYVGSLSPSRRRAQRQHGVRMLCDPSHLRNIQDMVDKMVQSGEQCAVSPPRAPSVGASPSPADDEGYSSLDENRRSGSISSVSSAGSGASSLSFRRSVDSITGACVSKNVRVKKSRSARGASKQT